VQLTTRGIALMRFLCGAGRQFSATDLDRTAIVCSGHRFLRTVLKIRRNGGRTSIYNCPCGEMAVRDDYTGEFMGLSCDASDRQIRPCRLTKLT
jgi:hypothetical protein